MPTTLTIELPDDLRARLERQAEANRRSLDDEVIRVLNESVGDDADRAALWERIRKRRQRMPEIAWDPAELKRKIEEGRQ